VATDRSIALALSGGGHRATLFTLGALMYVADSGRAKDVTSIASVSGGSLTNGFVAQTLDFQRADSGTFEREVAKPLAWQIARRGTLFSPWFSKMYLAALALGMPAAFLPIWLLEAARAWRVLAVVSLLALWVWFFGKRGWICGRSFRSTLFAPGGSATLLKDVARNVSHVICSTDLRTAQSVYFAGDFVYAYALGPGEPGSMPLYQAVQASAAFPGGFPPTRLSAGRYSFKGPLQAKQPRRVLKELVLTDGGVYDNMGDQWARGFEQRAEIWPWLAKEKQAPKQLLVVNASARAPWSPFRWGRIPFLGEVLSLLRINNIMYVNTTNVRRQEIVRSYDPAAPETHGDLPGVLVQIAQSPFQVADYFAKKAGTAVSDRAEAVIDALGIGSRDSWCAIARQDSEVGTRLAKLGPVVSARLLYHGYVTAMCNLHVVFGGDSELGGWPLLTIPPLGRFEGMVGSGCSHS
jgi:predicted acylesterase/phospholipase RssA